MWGGGLQQFVLRIGVWGSGLPGAFLKSDDPISSRTLRLRTLPSAQHHDTRCYNISEHTAEAEKTPIYSLEP